MNEREALKLALKTLEQMQEGCSNVIADKLHSDAVDLAKLVRKDCNKPINAIREALAQPEQEPIGINGLTEAETSATASVMGLVNTTPPQREWVGLSIDEFKFIASKYLLSKEAGLEYFKEEIEAKLREKNA